MKTCHLAIKLLLLTALSALTARAQFANVTVADSVVSLATNATKNYTFTDPANGLSAIVAVTMTPYSMSNASPVFTLLDFDNGYPTHLGIESGDGSGDGNWVDFYEAVNFSASLVSASPGILTNSIQFGITGLAIRLNNGSLVWFSSGTTNSLVINSESVVTLDTNLTDLADTAYSAQLNSSLGQGQYQLSDVSPFNGQSIVFNATFVEGTGAPVITANPVSLSGCSSNPAAFTATAYGYPTPAAQWLVETNGGSSFASIPGATNSTLLLTPALSDSGNQYQVIFTNSLGGATSTVATLTVNLSPATPVISLDATTILPESVNTATAIGDAPNYSWTISNGTITSATNEPTVTYTAGLAGAVTLSLTFGNDSGCTETMVTNLAISVGSLPGVSSNEQIYVSDDSDVIEQFGANGIGSIFACTGVGPNGLAFDRAGNLYVANSEDGTVVEYDTNGNGSLFASGFSQPQALAFDGAGNLYVEDGAANVIWKFDPAGFGSIVISNHLNSPDGLAFDRAGNLYAANFFGGNIWKFSTDGTSSLFSTSITNPCGIAFDGSGNLFVADYYNNAIWKLDPAGDCSRYTTNDVNGPVGVAFDTAGNLFAANDNDGSLSEFTPGGNGLVFGATNLIGTEVVAIWPVPPQLIPPAAAAFTALSATNDQFQFTVTGTVGETYILQTTTNLARPDWIPVSTNPAPFVFTQTNTTAFPQQFYRALVAP